MQIDRSRVLNIVAFVLTTLAATGALVAAGLSEAPSTASVRSACSADCAGTSERAAK
jgi:hypothetical protein